jgi:hypothetical protein
MGPAGILALTQLIGSGIDAGSNALAQRRQEKFAEKRAGLQDVLQSLNPQTQGDQPVRRGQGWAGFLGDTAADPLVQKGIADLINKVVNPSQKRATLPDASQALTGGGRFGAAGSGVPGAARRPSAASRAVAAPSPANPNRSTWTQEGTRTNFGPLAPPTAKDGPWRSWQTAPNYSGETAWAWPDGRRVTMEELRSQGFNPAWRRVHPLPSGARTPRSATSRGEGGLLDPLFSRLRG